MATQQPVWTRAFLKSLGAKDDEIDYQNGAVTYKNKPFQYTTPEADGKAYGSQNELDSLYKKFQGNDALDQYKTNITKPNTPFTYDINSIKADPLYTSQLGSYTQDTNRGTDTALVNLGRRGIGNSSSAVQAELSGQKSINDYANTKLAPQVIAEKYKQYIDANTAQDKQNQNLLGLANRYDDQSNLAYDRNADELKNEALRKQGNIDNANKLSETYGFGVLPKDSGEELFKQVQGAPTVKAMTEQRQLFTELVNSSDKLGYVTPELAQMLGIPAFTSTLSAQKEINDFAYKTGMLGVARQNANTSSANSGTSAERLAFDKEKAANKDAGGAKVSSTQFNDAFKTLQQKYGVARYKESGKDAKGKPIYDESAPPTYVNSTNPDQQAKIVTEVLQLGLNDEQTLQMWNKLGITEDQARQLLGG